MKSDFSVRFIGQLEDFPVKAQEKFYKQLGFLLKNLRHPSLHAKKYDETNGVWQARVDKKTSQLGFFKLGGKY